MNDNEENKIELTKDEAYAIAELIDDTLFDEIRNDTEIDSMYWLRNLIRGYEKLCKYGGYVGLTESQEEVNNNESICKLNNRY